MALQVFVWLLESVFTCNFNFVVFLGYQNITCFSISAEFWFQAQVPSIFMCMFVNYQFELIQMGPAEVALNVTSFVYVNSVISAGRGLLMMM